MNKIRIEQFNAATPEEFAAIVNGPPEVAACWLAVAAENGIADAQLRYGQMLLEGRGIKRDPALALRWFKAAADSSNALAMNMVGRCYENGWGIKPDATIATYWFRRAATNGSPWGMYNYATSLTLARGTRTNRAEAFRWLKKAAEMGHAKSMNILGGFYEDGWEVEPDEDTALDCYRRAAEGGDFRGQFNCARLLIERRQIAQAIIWLKRVPETATPAFMQKLHQFLANAELHELDIQIGGQQTSTKAKASAC
jgi:TPR repeat protein